MQKPSEISSDLNIELRGWGQKSSGAEDEWDAAEFRIPRPDRRLSARNEREIVAEGIGGCEDCVRADIVKPCYEGRQIWSQTHLI